MKLRLYFDLIVIVFFVIFVYEAREWRLQARLYPWVIGIPMIALAVIHLIREFVGVDSKKASSQAGAAPVDYQFTKGIDPDVARRRTINIFCWIFGFAIGVWLLGFAVAVPLFVFLYLKIQSSEGWPLSIALTGLAWLIFWGLFDWLLRLPFPDGLLFTFIGQ